MASSSERPATREEAGLVGEGGRRTRRRPKRKILQQRQSQKTVIQFINQWERKRRRLNKPTWRRPRGVTGKVFGPRQTDSLSLLGLLPTSTHLLQYHNVRQVEKLQEEERERNKIRASAEQAAAARAAAPQPLPPAPTGTTPLTPRRKVVPALPAASPALPTKTLFRPDDIMGPVPNKKRLMADLGLKGQKGTVRDLLVRLAEQRGITDKNDLQRFVAETRAAQKKQPPVKLSAPPPGYAEPEPGDDDYLPDTDEEDAAEEKKASGEAAQAGTGAQRARPKTVRPLYSSQIDVMMLPYRPRGYLGCFASDNLALAAQAANAGDVLSFVLNTAPSTEEGDHWVAVYCDFVNERELDYFDSLGDKPSDAVVRGLKAVVDARLNLPWLLKFKQSSVRVQADNTASCGLYAVRFLQDRYAGKSFKQASGYSEQVEGHIRDNERNVRRRFGYV